MITENASSRISLFEFLKFRMANSAETFWSAGLIEGFSSSNKFKSQSLPTWCFVEIAVFFFSFWAFAICPIIKGTPPIEWLTSCKQSCSDLVWICLLLSPNLSIRFIVMKSRFDLTSPVGLIPVVWFKRFSRTYWAFVTTAAILSFRAIVIACRASEKFQSTSIRVSFSICSRDATQLVQFLENSFQAV